DRSGSAKSDEQHTNERSTCTHGVLLYTSIRTLVRANGVQERVAEIRRLPRADSVHMVQIVKGFRASLDHVAERGVVENHVRRHTPFTRDPEPHGAQHIEQIAVGNITLAQRLAAAARCLLPRRRLYL